jgi:hypothetical protein
VLEQRFLSNEDEIAVLVRKSMGTGIPRMVKNEYERAIKYLKMDRRYVIGHAWRARRTVLINLLKTVLPMRAYELVQTFYRKM